MTISNRNEDGPSVSAIILAYNHAPYIRDCVKSIAACQTANTEIVVLDDCSTDGTTQHLRHMEQNHSNLRIIVNEENNSNIAANTQHLIDESRGKYILFMAGDDMLGENYSIMDATRRLDNDAAMACIIPRLTFMAAPETGSNPDIYDAKLLDALRSSDPHKVLTQHLFKRVSRLFLQGAVIRRSVIEDMGGFVSGTVSDDYAFFMRLFLHLEKAGHSFYFAETSTWRYRIHNHNIHRNAMRQFSSILEVVSRFVPDENWQTFLWDSMTFTTYEEISLANHMARSVIGPKRSQSLIRKISRSSISAAAKRRDRKFLSSFISDRRNSFGLKLYAMRKIMTAVVK